MRIAIVAGEASGDLLAAGLITEIKRRHPDAEVFGIAGPRMIEAGCEARFPLEKLSVMGLVEVLRHLPELLGIRKKLLMQLLENPPDVFVGVDAPDFNLALEAKLKAAGIKTVHYVSPTVWAWREKRIHKIAKSVDRMLTLFPFELDIYKQYGIDAKFVGHPLADMVPVEIDQTRARYNLGLPEQDLLLAVLPGSRRSEVERLSEPFLKAMLECKRQYPKMNFVVPLATKATRLIFEKKQQMFAPTLPITVIDGQSRTAMEASDYVLLASGTATLEATLLAKPMVVAYKLSALTYWIMKTFKMLKVDVFSLPNLLAGENLVDELIQDEVTPEALTSAVMRLIDNPERNSRHKVVFTEIYKTLKCDANNQAADAVLEMIK